MKIEADKIGVIYLSTPLNIGGASRRSIGANDARFSFVPGVGMLIESKGHDKKTDLVPWRSIDRMEIGGSALTLPPSAHVAAPPPPPPAATRNMPPAERPAPELSIHELRARDALEDRKRLAAERAKADAIAKARDASSNK